MIDRKPMARANVSRSGPSSGNTPCKPRPKLVGHPPDCHCDKCEPPPVFLTPPRRFLVSDDDIETLRVKLLTWRIFASILAATLITILCLISKYSP